MNRAPAIIFSFLLFWASGAYGFSGPCCCSMTFGSSIECISDGVAVRDPSCNHDGPCSECGCESLLSFRCVGEFKPLPASESESVRSEYQIFSLPVALVDVHDFLQKVRSIPRQNHSLRLNPTDLFLQTCSFLS